MPVPANESRAAATFDAQLTKLRTHVLQAIKDELKHSKNSLEPLLLAYHLQSYAKMVGEKLRQLWDDAPGEYDEDGFTEWTQQWLDQITKLSAFLVKTVSTGPKDDPLFASELARDVKIVFEAKVNDERVPQWSEHEDENLKKIYQEAEFLGNKQRREERGRKDDTSRPPKERQEPRDRDDHTRREERGKGGSAQRDGRNQSTRRDERKGRDNQRDRETSRGRSPARSQSTYRERSRSRSPSRHYDRDQRDKTRGPTDPDAWKKEAQKGHPPYVRERSDKRPTYDIEYKWSQLKTAKEYDTKRISDAARGKLALCSDWNKPDKTYCPHEEKDGQCKFHHLCSYCVENSTKPLEDCYHRRCREK